MNWLGNKLGGFIETVFNGNKFKARILILGLDASGKTTFIYKLKGDVETTIPTIGFNVETVEVRGKNLTCWDVGGCDKIRPLWRHFTQGSNCLIYVVDCNDWERFDEAKSELWLFLKDETLSDPSVSLIILANKQDLARAKSAVEIIKIFDLWKVRDRRWYIQETTMTSQTLANGLTDPFTWLESVMYPTEANVNKAKTVSGITSERYFEHESKFEELRLQRENERKIDTAANFAATYTKVEVDPTIAQIEEQKRQQNILRRQQALEEWVSREDGTVEEFMEALSSCTLAPWDHYNHVRAAWIHLAALGIQQGFRRIEQVLSHFIAHSANTNGKSYHSTMTRFWCHMIAYLLEVACAYDTTVLFDFKAFLRKVREYQDEAWFPDVTSPTLFKDWFSNQVMFGALARKNLARPDIKDLPELVQVFNRFLIPIGDSERNDQALAGITEIPQLMPAVAEDNASSTEEAGSEAVVTMLVDHSWLRETVEVEVYRQGDKTNTRVVTLPARFAKNRKDDYSFVYDHKEQNKYWQWFQYGEYHYDS